MVRRSLLLVVALALLPAPAACSSDEPAAAPTATPTPIAKLDTATVRLARAEFCDLLPAAEVRRALGGAPEADESWGNGDPVSGDQGTGDVGHELGCAWTRPNGAAARAWVFARPVSVDLATSVVAGAGRRRGCTSEQTAVFGSPALLQQCALPGGVVRERRAGLFGDTWLTCEVAVPGSVSASERNERLDAWCAQVVTALDTSTG